MIVKIYEGAIFVYVRRHEAKRGGQAGTFITLKSKILGDMLSLRNCIYMYTHIYIYIHIYRSLNVSIWLIKNTNCFTTIAPLTLFIIHSNF